MGKSGSNFITLLDTNDVFACFTTKFGGVSKGEFSWLNLAFHTGDDPNLVLENRKILAKSLNIDYKNLIFMDQIHSDEVEICDEIYKIPPKCDAIITNKKSLALCVMVADCSPVLLYDKNKKIISAIHAGRAGVCKKILTKTFLKMRDKFGCDARDLVAFVGPNIKRDCYEVKNLDLKEFNKFKFENKFNLNLALKEEMSNLGINEFYFSDICTHCDDRFYSYRRDGKTGRFAGVIMLK